MTERWLQEAVAACGLEPYVGIPRNLVAEVPLALPVELVPLAKLSSEKVRGWLARRGISHRVADFERLLHGCLVANAGRGFLFYDSEDGESEQRFTQAHEVAHFVLDHWLPRCRAERLFGKKIVPVLDRVRSPSQEEALAAVLGDVSLEIEVKLMERDPAGSIENGEVTESELRADRLALELLAPAARVIPGLKGREGSMAYAWVAECFGLPLEKATTHVQRLLRLESKPRFYLLESLEESMEDQ